MMNSHTSILPHILALDVVRKSPKKRIYTHQVVMEADCCCPNQSQCKGIIGVVGCAVGECSIGCCVIFGVWAHSFRGVTFIATFEL